MRRILFICWANCVRSQMAQAILTGERNKQFKAFSAGIVPSGFVHAYTLTVLREARLRVRGLKSKSWKRFQNKPLDAIIAFSNRAHIILNDAWPSLADDSPPFHIYWPQNDPTRIDKLAYIMTPKEQIAAFRETRDNIQENIRMLTQATQTTLNDDQAFKELLEHIGSTLK